MAYTLVISKYNENIEWLKKMHPCNRIFLYDKSDAPVNGSIPLKNIGRESSTYIHHILTHYNNLPNFTIFLQGDPFDHMDKNINANNFQELIDKIIREEELQSNIKTLPLFTPLHSELLSDYPTLLKKEYLELIIKKKAPQCFEFAAGAQYIVPREKILQHPIDFYQKLYRMLENGDTDDDGKKLLTWRRVTPSFDPSSIDAWTFERLIGYIFE